MSAELNAAHTRCVTDEAVFGYPAYEGSVIDGEFVGDHVGIFAELDPAREWLHGTGPSQPQPPALRGPGRS